MMNANISERGLYINKIIDVVGSVNRNRLKKTRVSGRHSDALIFVSEGSCAYWFEDGRHITVHEGDILYLARGSQYEMMVLDECYKVVYCDFEFEGSEPRRSDYFTPHNKEYVENLFSKLKNVFHQHTKASFAESLSILYSIYAAAISSTPSDYVTRSVKNKMIAARQYIDSHVDDAALSVSTLAHINGMSEVYFRKLFKSAFGCAPSEYITSAKLKRARKLMNYPFLSLEECAIQSGFSSLQYFCRVFKNEMGITPLKYRNSLKN